MSSCAVGLIKVKSALRFGFAPNVTKFDCKNGVLSEEKPTSFTTAGVPPSGAKLPVGTSGDLKLMPEVESATAPCDIWSVPKIGVAADTKGTSVSPNTADSTRTKRAEFLMSPPTGSVVTS